MLNVVQFVRLFAQDFIADRLFDRLALGVAVPSALLSVLPYIGTIVVLVLISRDAKRIRLHRAAVLGRPFQARA